MSAFKKLKTTDAFVTTYVAKKDWAVTGSNLSSYGIQFIEAFSSSKTQELVDDDRVYNPPGAISIDFNGNYLRKIAYRGLNQLYYSNYNQTNGSIIEPKFLTAALSGSHVETDETSSGKLFYNYEESSINYVAGVNALSGSRELGQRAVIYSLPRSIVGTHIEPGSFKLIPRYNTNVIQEPYVTDEYVEVGYVEASDIGDSGYLGGLEAIIDDGEGHLRLIETDSSVIGNIIYSHGLIILTNSDVANYFAGVDPRLDILRWKSNQPIYTYNYHAKISDYEYNHTQNPSALTGSDNRLKNNVSGSDFQPYITTVGLYNDAQELIAVGKLSQPLQKPADTELTIQVKLDI